MPRKNLRSLHEAIVVALINTDDRQASFGDIAKFILQRDLYPIRKGNTPLAKQIMLRSTKASGFYSYLFEETEENTIKLKNI